MMRLRHAFLICCLLILGGGSAAQGSRMLTWAGHDWIVKSGYLGPGPNNFCDDVNTVWVDAQERLHLRVNPGSEIWCNAEVYTTQAARYGTYRFYVDSPLHDLNENVILGLFLYGDDTHEIDIEVAKWGDPGDAPNSQYVVQPYYIEGHIERFYLELNEVDWEGPTLHEFDWQPEQVAFRTLAGHDPATAPVINEWVFDLPGVPQETDILRMDINLWSYTIDGETQPPSDFQPVEVILSNFEAPPAFDVPTVSLLAPEADAEVFANPVTLMWSNDIDALWHRLYLQGMEGAANGTILDDWHDAQETCEGETCQKELQLANGYYLWCMQAWGPGDLSEWDCHNFYVSIGTPQPPQNIQVTPNQGRPTVIWNNDENASWYRLAIVQEGSGLVFDNWYEGAAVCGEEGCTVDPAFDALAGTYTAWMQAWGPEGFSGPGGINSVAGWNSSDPFVLADVPASDPTDIGLHSPVPTFSWQSGANSTWYNAVMIPSDESWSWDMGWFQAADLACVAADETCYFEETRLHGCLLPEGDYTLWVRAWGPGGFSDFTSGTFSYVCNAAVNLSVPTLCAEEDNVNVPIYATSPGDTTYTIVATHPDYDMSPDFTAPKFDDCIIGGDPPEDPPMGWDDGGVCQDESCIVKCWKAYDDGTTVVEACYDRNWNGFRMSDSATMMIDVPDNMFEDALPLDAYHRFVMYRRLDVAEFSYTLYPQVLVMYEDGNARIKPQVPTSYLSELCDDGGDPDPEVLCDTVFGSSVIIGPAIPGERPIVDVASITLSLPGGTPQLTITYEGGGSATVDLSVDQQEAVAVVDPDYNTQTLPFATFRSMFVRDDGDDMGTNEMENIFDVAFVDNGTGERDIMDTSWSPLSGTEWFFYRTERGMHNISAPDITIQIGERSP